MSVSLNALMAAGNQGSAHAVASTTSFSTTGITVAAGTNTVLVVTVGWQGTAAPTSRSVTWNGVTMTERAFVTGTAGSDVDCQGIYVLTAPATGAKTLAGSWTNSNSAYISAIALDGADQTTGIATGDTVTGNAVTITVAGSVDGATIAAIIRDGTVVSSIPFGTLWWNYDGGAPGGSGAYALGSAGSNVFDFSGATDSGARGTAAVHVIVPFTPPPAIYPVDVGSNRPRPGRGPYSVGRYFRQSSAAFVFTPVVNVTLSGLAIATAQGTAGAQTAVLPSGQSITSFTGVLSPALSLALSGSAVSVSQGTLVGTLSLPIPGLAITSAQGSLGPALSVGLTGLLIAVGQGTVSTGADKTVTLSGSAIAVSTGTLGPQIAVSVSGSAATLFAGTLSPATSVALTGAVVTANQGSVIVNNGVTVSITGQAIALTTGSLLANPSVALHGLSASFALGALGIGGPIPSSGQTVTVEGVGSFTVYGPLTITVNG